jgi:PTS system nitrogen regulatory IIA component
MQIDVKTAARLLGVSEKTIYNWAGNGDLPCHRVHQQYRFNPAEILEWATARGMPVSPDIFSTEAEPQALLPGLEQAIFAGGIHDGVRGSSKAEVLAAVVDLMRLPADVDRRFLLEVLLARESLGSTAVGDGIAIPHVRNPIVLHIPAPTITVCFLEQAVDFAALDGKPVHTLFAIVSPTVRAHLHLLSVLSYGLRREEFRSAVLSRDNRDDILAGARSVDQAARFRAEARDI